MSATVYTTPTCGYCHMMKQYLKSKGVEFSEKDITVDKKAYEEILDKTGRLGVPVLDVDGKIVVGFDRNKVDIVLKGA